MFREKRFVNGANRNQPAEAMHVMGRLRHINLEDIPWPISILKVNEAVLEMRPGDRIIFFLKDADVINNLLKLLRHQADVAVAASTSGGDFSIEVEKKKRATNRIAATDSHRYR